MFTKDDHHIGDTWYYVHENEVHMFYLTCSASIRRHSCWSIGHAVSSDLTNWHDHGIILAPGEENSWDGLCPATGSIIKHNDLYYMAYTGNFAGPKPTVGLAISQDLYTWEKYSGTPS